MNTITQTIPCARGLRVSAIVHAWPFHLFKVINALNIKYEYFKNLFLGRHKRRNVYIIRRSEQKSCKREHFEKNPRRFWGSSCLGGRCWFLRTTNNSFCSAIRGNLNAKRHRSKFTKILCVLFSKIVFPYYCNSKYQIIWR